MDVGAVSGTLQSVHDRMHETRIQAAFRAGAGKVPGTLRVTAARGHLRRQGSSTMLGHRRRRPSLHLTPRRS